MNFIFSLILLYQIYAKPHNQHTLLDQNAIQSYDFISNVKLYDLTLLSSSYQQRKQLEFTAFNQTFKLILKPEEQFGKYYVGDEEFDIPQITFSGEVYEGHEPLRNSFARLVIVDDHIDGLISMPSMGMLHIKSTRDYSNSRRDQDVALASPLSRPAHQKFSKLVLIRDVDPMEATGDTCKLGDDPGKCAFQNLLVKRDTSPAVESTCGVQDSHVKAMFEADSVRNTPFKRELESKFGLQSKASSCPLPSKQLLAMGVAADCSYVIEKGGISQALAQILSNWNSASAVYEKTFNVQLGVAKVMIQQSCSSTTDPVTPWNVDCSNPSYTISDRLSDFSKWRGTISSDGMGLWHLMTKCSTQPAVGIAWLKMLCQTSTTTQSDGGQNQVVSGTGVSSIVPVEWKVVAHEIGHNFGAIHDCTSSTCSSQCSKCSPSCDCGGQYLMNPLDNSISDAFSPGSIDLICAGKTDIYVGITSMGTCLMAPDALKLVSSGICGNGVKEGGEECDCGPANSTTCINDTCCDGSTCKLKPNMKCDPLNDLCCTNNCMVKPATEVCHKGDGICDNTINCPGGDNPSCPFDTFVADGTGCTSVAGLSLTCASGQCTSRDQQCIGNGTVTTVKACPQFGNDCQLNCQDAQGNCFQLTGNFLDGTTCGGSGRCKKGNCEGSTIFSQAILWIQTFPQYAWPIIIILGLIILSSIFSCVRGCCCRRNQRAYTQPAYPQASNGRHPHGPNARNNRASAMSTNSQAGLNQPHYHEGGNRQSYVPPGQPQLRQQLSNDQLKRLSDQRSSPKIVHY